MKYLQKSKEISNRSILKMKTVIYLVKHAEDLKENGIRNTDETSDLINEKYILSVKGEKQAEAISKNLELKDIDTIWSSSYTRAKATAKYIAHINNIELNIDSSLNERKLGSLEDISRWMKNKTCNIVQAYMQDKNWKATNGESFEEAKSRVTKFFNRILKEYINKRIVLVSHGALISFLLTNWCTLNNDLQLVYNNKITEVKEPSIIKLTFNGKKLLNMEQVEID